MFNHSVRAVFIRNIQNDTNNKEIFVKPFYQLYIRYLLRNDLINMDLFTVIN